MLDYEYLIFLLLFQLLRQRAGDLIELLAALGSDGAASKSMLALNTVTIHIILRQ